MLSDIKIDLPINSNGEIDIFAQNQIVKKIIFIKETKQKVEEYKKKINKLNIEIKDISITYKPFYLLELFNIKSGNSKLTKTFIEKNKGDFPVYSANTKNNGVLGYLNTYSHECECLQMTTNGNAGIVFYRREHEFSINGDARLLIKQFDELDYQYLAYEVQKEFKKHNFNWKNKPSIDKLKDIEIIIPINKNGKFDLKIQKEIAEKYKKVESIKSAINLELDKISEIEISF